MPKRVVITLDETRMIWQARETYRAQTFWLSVFYLPQFFLVLMLIHDLHAGLWGQAGAVVAALAGLHMVRYVARRSWRVWRGLFLLALVVGLSGCGDLAHQYQRTVFGIDCRAEKLHNGQCVAAR